jgi:hypothetical protein
MSGAAANNPLSPPICAIFRLLPHVWQILLYGNRTETRADGAGALRRPWSNKFGLCSSLIRPRPSAIARLLSLAELADRWDVRQMIRRQMTLSEHHGITRPAYELQD